MRRQRPDTLHFPISGNKSCGAIYCRVEKKPVAKLCVKNNTAPRCAAAAGSGEFQGTRAGAEQRALSPSPERPRAVCVWRLWSQKSRRRYFTGKKKLFREDLLGQGDRKAEVLLVCFWRMFSSFLRYLSLRWQAPEPGMRASGAPARPCSERTEMPRAEDVPRFRPRPHREALPMSRESSFRVGIYLQPLWSLGQRQPLAWLSPEG